MIQHIAELNRVLLTANALLTTNNEIAVSTLINHCKAIAIEARTPDHNATIKFCIDIGLLQSQKKNKLSLTAEGKVFVQLNNKGLYDLSANQKKYLLRSFFLDGKFRKDVKQCFKCFASSERKKTFIWSATDSTPFGKNDWIINHMEQLGVIRSVKTGFEIKRAFVETVSSFVSEPKGYTEEDLFKWLAEKKKLGNFAEALVLNFERERLRNLGLPVEASCVKPVGTLKTNAGYDIESFNGRSKNMHFDRFIEVKGSGDPKLRFVWSQNEMKVAQELKEKYWIYYQGGIDKKTGVSKYKPIMLQDPFHSIPMNTSLTRTEHGVVIAGPLRGDLI